MWTIFCTTANLGAYHEVPRFAFGWNSTMWIAAALPDLAQPPPRELFLPWLKVSLEVWDVAGGGPVTRQGKPLERQPQHENDGWNQARAHLAQHFDTRVTAADKKEVAAFLSVGTAGDTPNDYRADSESWPGAMASFSNQGALVGKQLGGTSIHALAEFKGGDEDAFDAWIERLLADADSRIVIIPVPPGWTSTYIPDAARETEHGSYTFEIGNGIAPPARIEAKACAGTEETSVWKTTLLTTGGFLQIPAGFNHEADTDYRKKNWRRDYLNQAAEVLSPVAWFGVSKTFKELVKIMHDRADAGMRFPHSQFDPDTGKLLELPLTISQEIFKLLTGMADVPLQMGVDGTTHDKLMERLSQGEWVRMVSQAVDLWGGDEYRELANALREERLDSETFDGLLAADPPIPGILISKTIAAEISKELARMELPATAVTSIHLARVRTEVDAVITQAGLAKTEAPAWAIWIANYLRERAQRMENFPLLPGAKLAEVSDDEDFLIDLFIRQWELLALIAANDDTILAGKRWEAVIGAKRLSDRRTALQKALRDSGRSLFSRYGDGLAGAVLSDLKIPNAIHQNAASEATEVGNRIKAAMGNLAKRAVGEGQPRFLQQVSLGDLPAAPESIAKQISEIVARGTGAADLRRTMPQPLRMDLPRPGADEAQQRQFQEDLSGVLVMLSRQDAARRWRCLNSATLEGSFKGTDLQLRIPALSPFQLNSSGGVLQGVVDYQERPVGVELADTRGSAIDKDPAKVNASGLHFRHMQLAKLVPEAWGEIPYLAYQKAEGGRSNEYHSAWIPVHSSGALPPEVAIEGDPSELKKPADLPAPQAGAFSNYAAYLRRVPVGGVRLSGRLAKPSERPFGATKPIWEEFKPRLAPSTVASLTKELLKEAKPDEKDEPTVYLLWSNEGSMSRPSCPKIDFHVRPPSTEPENWSRGFRTAGRRKVGETDAQLEQFLINVADDYHDLVRDPDEGMNPTGEADFPFGKASDLIDDYAVTGLKVEVHEMLIPGIGRPQLSFNPVANFVLGLDDPKPRVEYGQALDYLRRVQKVFNVPLATQGVNLTPAFEGKIAVSRAPSGASVGLRQDGGTLEILVPPGRICVLTLHPLISEAAESHFDKIHDPALEALTVPTLGTVYQVPGAERIMHFEAVPMPSDCLPQASEIWKRLSLETNNARRLKVSLAPLVGKVWGENWPYVGAVEARIQRWRIGGAEQEWGEIELKQDDGSEKMEIRPKLFRNVVAMAANADQSLGVDAMLKNELGDFANIADNDVESSEERISLAALLGKGQAEQARLTVYDEAGTQTPWPVYLRASVKVRSRYFDLPGFEGATRTASHSITLGNDEVLSTSYKRHVLPGRLTSPLGPPRIKMLIPLIDAEGDERESHPGFIALCLEPLVSPFHLLEGNIVRTGFNGAEYPEMGFDPLTSPQGLSSANHAPAPLMGRPFGLTVEREGADAAYPFSAYFFACPGLTDKWKKAGRAHDLFVKLAFRWTIWEGKKPVPTMDATKAELTGMTTGDWQVRLLARQGQVAIRVNGEIERGPDGDPKLYKLSQFTFSLDGMIPLFFDGERQVEIVPPPSEKSASMYMTFAFLSWSMTRDVLSGAMTKNPENIHLLAENGTTWHKVWERSSSSPGEQTTMGQFVMIMARKGGLLADDRKTLAGFFSALFPDQGKEGSKDPYVEARMMINRIFKPIGRKKAAPV
jgi:hypothetical protein